MAAATMKPSTSSGQINKVNVEKCANFMRQFRDPQSRELKKLTANQFMEVWSHYDKDGEWACFACYVNSYIYQSTNSDNKLTTYQT